MANLLLALDSSTRATGWAVFRLDNLDKPLAYGVKKFNGDLHERLYQSGAWLDGKIQDYRWWGSMAILAIEGQVVAKNKRTPIMLAQVAGALKYVAMAHGLDIIEIAQGQRKTVLGLPLTLDSKSSKIQVTALVNARFGLELGADEHDAADALAVGLAAVNLMGWGER